MPKGGYEVSGDDKVNEDYEIRATRVLRESVKSIASMKLRNVKEMMADRQCSACTAMLEHRFSSLSLVRAYFLSLIRIFICQFVPTSAK